MKYSFIDLHTHSVYSNEEGCDALPEKLLDQAEALACNMGKDCVLSITDHNSVIGSRKAIRLMKEFPERWAHVKFISGIEFNVGLKSIELSEDGKSTFSKCHCVAYDYDVNDKELLTYSKLVNMHFKFHGINVNTGIQVLAALKVVEQNYNITIPFTVIESCLNATRHSEARNNFFNSINSYLKQNSYIRNDKIEMLKDLVEFIFTEEPQLIDNAMGVAKIDIIKATNLIKNAGGRMVIAHPNTIRYNKKDISGTQQLEQLDKFISIIQQKTKNGLSGLEIFHSMNTFDDTMNNLYELAKKYNLYLTAGSDNHGSLKPDSMISKCMNKDYEMLSVETENAKLEPVKNVVEELAFVDNIISKTKNKQNKQYFSIVNIEKGNMEYEDLLDVIELVKQKLIIDRERIKLEKLAQKQREEEQKLKELEENFKKKPRKKKVHLPKSARKRAEMDDFYMSGTKLEKEIEKTEKNKNNNKNKNKKFSQKKKIKANKKNRHEQQFKEWQESFGEDTLYTYDNVLNKVINAVKNQNKTKNTSNNKKKESTKKQNDTAKQTDEETLEK